MDAIKHWRQVVSADSRDLHFWDLIGRSPLAVTIERTYSGETEGADPQRLLYLELKGEKPLGIKVTNSYLIGLKYGDNPENWAGKQVTLRIAKCKGQYCVRVDAPPGTKLPRQVPKFNYVDDVFNTGPEKLPASDYRTIQQLVADTKTDMAAMLAHYGLDKLSDITRDQFQAMKKALETKLQKQLTTNIKKETDK